MDSNLEKAYIDNHNNLLLIEKNLKDDISEKNT